MSGAQPALRRMLRLSLEIKPCRVGVQRLAPTAIRVQCVAPQSQLRRMSWLSSRRSPNWTTGTGSFARQGLTPAFSRATAAAGQTRSLFIQTMDTPNPASLMFMPGKEVLEGSTASFTTAREAMASPLAKALFQIDGVTNVFFGSDFVTVTKSDDYTWPLLKPDIFAAITEFYSSGQSLMYDMASVESSDHLINDDDDEVVAMIKELLETRIRPTVQQDGGDIAFRGFDPETGIVKLKMMGSCSGCPSSSMTLKSGIENMLMHYIPEVRSVIEDLPDEAETESVKAFNKLEEHLSY